MITVAGFNTAIDRRVELRAALQPGVVQRAADGRALPGGKGLHVAQMAAELGEPAQLVGLSDAAHDALIAAHLRARRVTWHGVRMPHALRQCLALHQPDGRITEILEPGATLDADIREALLERVHTCLDASDILVLSGSLPRGFSADTYAMLAREAARRGVPCLVDASGDALRHALEASPTLVKPNADEAAAMVGHAVHDAADAMACARLLHRRGVHHAVVTLGAQGAVGFDGRQAWHAALAVDDARNTVGSGDCFLAGLAVALRRGQGMPEALRLATACGAANARSEETGFADAAHVAAELARVQVRAWPDASAGGAPPD